VEAEQAQQRVLHNQHASVGEAGVLWTTFRKISFGFHIISLYYDN
jgi:hypothetical protein